MIEKYSNNFIHSFISIRTGSIFIQHRRSGITVLESTNYLKYRNPGLV